MRSGDRAVIVVLEFAAVLVIAVLLGIGMGNSLYTLAAVAVLGMALFASRRHGLRAREASTTATGEWPPERVRELFASADGRPKGDRGRVQQVRALRLADRRLSLRDAVQLVDAAAATADR